MNRTANEMAISLKGLRKGLGALELGPIDLDVEQGYVVAIVGPNGSGKSSLFRLLMNIMKPAAGSIRIVGKEYADEEIEIKRRIGYVPEITEWNQLNCRTIKELKELVSRWYPAWNEETYAELLQRFGLNEKQKLKHLSKGMQRKLAFIQAIAYNPDLLLLDEPTAGLDPFAWRTMLDELVRFMETGGKTVLLATHILEEVRRLADYVAFMYEGRLLGFYEKDALFDKWKTFWIDQPLPSALQLPGVVAAEQQGVAAGWKLVSDSPMETEAALERLGVAVIRMQAIELDEILSYLIRKQRVGTIK